MKRLKMAATTLSLLLAACAAHDKPQGPSLDDVRAVSPALAHNTQALLLGEVWRRPGLSPRDRSLVTVAALIARNQPAELAVQLNLALDNGVTPAEVSETINHLAFYSGWGTATAAIPVARQVFANRGITAAQLPPVSPPLLPLDQAAEQARAAYVDKLAGPVSPGLVQYTGSALFHDLWLRPGLAPRDRSLVTVSALIANGQMGQLAAHLNRAMDNGLTQPQAAEMLTQLAFYAGWPNVFTAVPVVNGVFASRQPAQGNS